MAGKAWPWEIETDLVVRKQIENKKRVHVINPQTCAKWQKLPLKNPTSQTVLSNDEQVFRDINLEGNFLIVTTNLLKNVR